jgi:hypothetical protein
MEATLMLNQLKSSDFTPHLNQGFRLDVGAEEPLTLELVRVSLFGGATEPVDEKGRRTPFSVLFRGPLGVYLPQQIYRLEHDGMGTLDLFLVPMAPDTEGSLFEAVFA